MEDEYKLVEQMKTSRRSLGEKESPSYDGEYALVDREACSCRSLGE